MMMMMLPLLSTYPFVFHALPHTWLENERIGTENMHAAPPMIVSHSIIHIASKLNLRLVGDQTLGFKMDSLHPVRR